MKYIDQFKASRRAGVPIVIIRTADYASVVTELQGIYDSTKPTPFCNWDICRGISGLNPMGVQAAKKLNQNSMEMTPAQVTGNPVEALTKALDNLPNESVLFMMNLHIILESNDDNRIAVIQAIWNCRDPFKSSKRTLVILCPSMKVPIELSNDVITLDTDLPTDKELTTIVTAQFEAAGLDKPKADLIKSAVDSISGLSEFSAEQVTAMSLSKKGLDIPAMWDRKKTLIEQAGGLRVHRGESSFDDLGGLEVIKRYLRLIIKGKHRPKLIVLLDEIEKQVAGRNDSSGTGMDALQQVLTNMQDNDWGGILFPGFPGSGKTECGKAMGQEAGGLFLTMDMGGMKSKWVGDSEKLVRAAMKVLLAMGGADVFFIGTCNSMVALPPELKRRFSYGTFFFDLPTIEEQAPIWEIYFKKFEIRDQELPRCSGWTGAEIKACCQRADEFSISLVDASQYIAPVVKTMGKDVAALRESAHEKYLSASKPGFYDMNDREGETNGNGGRSYSMESSNKKGK